MSDKLDKYGSPEYPPLEKKNIPKLIAQQKAYEAFAKVKGMERVDYFKIYDRNSNFTFYYYGHLLEGSFEDGELTLITTNRIYTLTGKNLDKLAELFSEKKVKAIYEFNPQIHESPTDGKAIIIEKIERGD